jgi:hypothetical protein
MRSFLSFAVLLTLAPPHGPPVPTDGDTGSDASAPLRFEKFLLDGSHLGWLFPAYGDMDGDGTLDLLVGVNGDKEKGEGRLLVFLNRGTDAAPAYANPYWFDDVVPSGRIPEG